MKILRRARIVRELRKHEGLGYIGFGHKTETLKARLERAKYYDAKMANVKINPGLLEIQKLMKNYAFSKAALKRGTYLMALRQRVQKEFAHSKIDPRVTDIVYTLYSNPEGIKGEQEHVLEAVTGKKPVTFIDIDPNKKREVEKILKQNKLHHFFTTHPDGSTTVDISRDKEAIKEIHKNQIDFAKGRINDFEFDTNNIILLGWDVAEDLNCKTPWILRPLVGPVTKSRKRTDFSKQLNTRTIGKINYAD